METGILGGYLSKRAGSLVLRQVFLGYQAWEKHFQLIDINSASLVACFFWIIHTSYCIYINHGVWRNL